MGVARQSVSARSEAAEGSFFRQSVASLAFSPTEVTTNTCTCARKEQSMDWSSGKKCTFLALFAFWVIAITAAGAWAQSGTTSLRGTVTDKSGAAVSGAKITLSNPDQALNRQATSGSEGEYEFIALPPGTYTLTVEASGFRKFEQNKLQLLVNSPAT